MKRREDSKLGQIRVAICLDASNQNVFMFLEIKIKWWENGHFTLYGQSNKYMM